ncbi:hypothetical protein MTP09_14010 [Chryseobacterium suipulveris]|uniref:DUF748 domain-containing protein n=1 Tax=Chryseobacterium suipulveris TaxID=2929800 RepID=A0ABY4BP74_9FLAO|nr:hypothetical protein [Chryseobacterium suipulveris]UOE40999.1 hypothetical protein MTP09_14010 [Chryseobacterium suipulveris]
MRKNYLRIFATVLGIFVLLFLVANFGLNYWLKTNLPNYLKNNSDYIISYKSLDVDLGTGNIFSTGISINSKNPQNQNVIGLQGTVDTLSISRLGIYDAIFRKRINSSDLLMKNPRLNIILAKPVDEKTGKKRNPVVFENIKISDGDIQIFRFNKQKFLSVSKLNLDVENLQMTEESVEEKLPIVFDKYEISGKDFFFRPDNVYAFTAKYVTTKDNQMSIKDFAMVPLLSYQNFRRFYPKKRNLFDFKSSEMEFKDIHLKKNKISLTNLRFEYPELKVFTTNSNSASKEKSFKYKLELENAAMNNAKVNILQPDGNPLFTAGNLNVNIDRFVMDDESAKGNIPFNYDDFRIKGQNIIFNSNRENVKISAMAINPKSADLRNISVKPTVSVSDKALMDLNAKQINLKIKEWNLLNSKLKLDVQNVLVNGLNGKVTAPKNPNKKKPDYGGIQFPLRIRNIDLRNSNLVFDNQDKPLVFNDLNAKIQNLEMNEKTVLEKIPFKTDNYTLTTKNFSYRINQFYQMNIGVLTQNKNSLQVNNFSLKPLVSRAQFIRMIPAEKDLYDLKVNQISAKGNWDLGWENKYLDASQVTLNGVNANIFRSKIPKDDLTEKPLYSKLLRSIKFPVFVQNLDLRNSLLVYEEDTKKSDGPGKLIFSNFNMNVKNLNSGKSKGKPTLVPITINCRFMDASPMNVKWNFDTAKMDDAFSISGNISSLPASEINPFIEPYLKIRATGNISDLRFEFDGNKSGLDGGLRMKHQKLQVALLKSTGEKDKILSAVANVFVKSNSGDYPESVSVENVQRDPTKSFFNLFWRGIEQGLKKTLIGKNAPQTETKIRNTVEATKTTVTQTKSDFKHATTEVKGKVQEVKESVKEKGFLRGIFKKKFEK